MNILFYKKKMIAILTIGTLSINVFPTLLEAAQSTPIIGQQEMYFSCPTEFKSALAQTDASMIIMQSYVKNIQKQPEIFLENIQIIDDDLRSDIIYHQKIAKENAIKWEKVKNNILKTNQSIIEFNTQIQLQYQHLFMALQEKQSEKLQYNIKNLLDLVSQNKNKSEQMAGMLQEFQFNIEEDVRNFKKDVNILMPIIDNEIGYISGLQNQINANYEVIKKNKDILWDLISSGRANTNNLADVKKKIATTETDIQRLKASLSGIQSDVSTLIDTQNNMNNIIEVITLAIKALQEIKQQWDIVQTKCTSLLKSIDDMDPEVLELMKADLMIAKKEWQDLKEYVEQLQNLYENEE
ncbi:HBL/NHE enterotoxin family protein [Bacillus sp. SRB3LM]|uniref:HBL/NHE enterotoxin family protein n=1 Tax=Bacillus sp. SRB3LM TaxID=2608689 RepID=UPI0018C4477B|nr:HBL/NHE enterotoxin family protein [Bacillus sp. SRB3LM]MBG0969264.1 HBL/NHE enterotoxin family protein [Bacillus sp. SRB3LM]MBG0971067.1 HBL/NHE enterotoxin family protein [Bacillus sp. SRB3LM]